MKCYLARDHPSAAKKYDVGANATGQARGIRTRSHRRYLHVTAAARTSPNLTFRETVQHVLDKQNTLFFQMEIQICVNK